MRVALARSAYTSAYLQRTQFRTPTVCSRVHAHPPWRDQPIGHRLLASSRDELARVTARVAELTAKHEAAKAALTQLVLAVAVHPLTYREAVARATAAAAAAAAREGGGEGVRSRGTAAVAVEGEASRRPAARGTGAGGAAVELVEISGPAGMEEGRSL